MRGNLHVGVGFLSATSGVPAERRLRFGRAAGLAYMEAGEGDPVVMIHGLGGTKASFLPTVVSLARAGYHAIAIDQPGFGDSHKPLFAAYDAPFMARAAIDFLDARAIESAHFIGNSLGGRVTLELGLAHGERARKLALLACSLPWKRRPPWARYLPLLRPELGLIQPAPRPIVEEIVRRSIPNGRSGWAAAGSTSSSARTARRAGARPSTPRHVTSCSSDQPTSGSASARSSAKRCSCGGATTGSSRPPSSRTSAPRFRVRGTPTSTPATSRNRASRRDRGRPQALPGRLKRPANRRWIWRASSSSIALTSQA